MSSVLSAFSQRNTNVTQVIPERLGEPVTIGNIENAVIYKLDIKGAHLNKGNYFVDLSALDASKNVIDFTGTFHSIQNQNANPLNTAFFVPVIDTNAAVYPGLEFTLTFRNISSKIGNPGIPTIGILSPFEGPPLPYIMSPPFPPTLAPRLNPNLTFKSDGETFEVCGSGPAGWLGVPALSVILAGYENI